MKKRYSNLIAAFMLSALPTMLLSPVVASANNVDFSKLSIEQVRDALDVRIRTVQHMALNPIVIDAVKDQNAEKLKPATVKTREKAWKKSKADDPFRLSLQNNTAGKFLERKLRNKKEINEAVLTDNQGVNVATYRTPRDYNHAKHETWKSSFNKGDGTIFVSRPQRDRRTGKQTIQISAPVMDKGTTIGVLVVDLALDNLNKKKPVK